MDYFYSIEDDRRIEIKIRRSTFICSLKYVETILETKEFISSISSEHKMATHNCWAYIVGDKGQTSHSSDNGEPAGTAGKPMLNALQSHEMTNIAAVVTRYYGGVKLGVRGLIDAYGEAVTSAIELLPLKKLVKVNRYSIDLPYSFNDTLLHHLQNFQVRVTDTQYSDIISHNIEVEEEHCPDVELMLTQYQDSGILTFSNKNL
ncbi:MAG: YigZ family protein [Desulfamplus sp.]|nr:YigZ family protein [Desulfamplus sp.]